jgi:RNA polymerase sigma-70 factor (ECF subfamily)
MRYAEIATALGISVKTVESQMGKALGLLRVRLAAWLPATEQS